MTQQRGDGALAGIRATYNELLTDISTDRHQHGEQIISESDACAVQHMCSLHMSNDSLPAACYDFHVNVNVRAHVHGINNTALQTVSFAA